MTKTKHGLRPAGNKSRAYTAWAHMRSRCNSPSDPGYKNYGGRGIKVCPEWDDYARFLSDMGELLEGMSLDRIDNNKGYSKENCRWTTPLIQMQNTRRNKKLTFRGESLCVSEWSKRTGLSESGIHLRIKLGWPVERILTAPADKHVQTRSKWITYGGETKTIGGWARSLGMNNFTLYKRLSKGWSPERAFIKP